MDLMESCQLPARFAYSVLFGGWSLLWSVSVPGAICFNVDVEHPLIFTGPQGSYFGAATELVVDKSKWVLVGATKDNFTDNPDIPSPGNVYACPVDFSSETECSVLSSLRTSETNANVSMDAYEEGNQLLGATILVPESTKKPIKICAPNWKNLRFLSTSGYFQAVGNCFHLNNRSDLNNAKVNAFRVKKDDLEYYASPLIGFSIADSTNMENSQEWKQSGPVIFDEMVVPPLPPLIQDAKQRFEEIQNLQYRKDDILLVNYPKSGTHWLWEILHMILKQKAEYSKEPKEFFFLEAMPDISMVQNMASPRTLNTHVPYRWLPKQHIENGGKIIHVVRNPKDVAVSLYHHLTNMREFASSDPGNFDDFFETKFMNLKVKLMGGWFKYEQEFEQAEKNDTLGAIFTVHYESLKKNPLQETKRLAKFLNVDLNDENIEDIADKCSFKKLKLASRTVKDNSLVADEVLARKMDQHMYRKGEIGDWKNHFTVAMNEKFDAIFKEEMKDSNIQVPVFDTFYGGPNIGKASTGGMISMNDGTLQGVEALPLVVEKSDAIKDTYLAASLLGFSVATGKMSQPSFFVLGAPGFSNKNGNIGAFSVFVFGALSQIKQIEGKQVGGGFGQTICLVDVNGDGIDEILVAAPNWFYDDISRNQVIHDVGKVYVYYGNIDSSKIIDEPPQELKGSLVSFARFGTAIAGIGDINKDGFNDVAIGAPFENNEGAVYIFNGKQTRMESMYSQKILGSQLEYGLQGFGFYISRTAKDLDDNTFSGEGLNNTDIDFTITLDANETKQRVEVVGTEGSRDMIEVKEFLIFPNTNHCYIAELRVPVIDRNFFQTMERPIVLLVDYKISNMSEPGKVRAILNRETVPTFSGEVRFDTGCKAEDGTCLSNLNLNVTVDRPRILVGNDTFLRMKTSLRNLGEPSFNTSLIIHYPDEIIVNTLKYGPISERMICKESGLNTRFCEVLNPFYQRMVGEVDIIFEVSKDAFEKGSGFVSKSSIDINVTATTRNDTYPVDNTVIKKVDVAVYSRVTLQVSTSSEQITASNKSIQFSNTYGFINEGPCGIETANLILYIPVRSKDKVFLKQEDLKVSSKIKTDSCKLTYYPSGELKSTTPNPLPGSSTLKYNNSDTNVILVDGQNSENSYFQPQRDDTGSLQYIFCDDGTDLYKCATVECSVNMVKPTDIDSRAFVLSFDMLINDLPKLEKGKSILTFVTRGQVLPSQRSQVPLVLKSNVLQEAYVSILLPDSFTQDVEEVDLMIIILGSVGGLLLFLLLGVILWKCGFFKREKRKQVEDFKRKSRYSMRKSRMASVRSGKTGTGSVRSRVPEEERLTKKFDEMDDEQFTT
uniref:Estrogen sulfotransferase n=1 Tax=Magallana gigas TaxID=29159 RepID=K1PIV5_MAGGI